MRENFMKDAQSEGRSGRKSSFNELVHIDSASRIELKPFSSIGHFLNLSSLESETGASKGSVKAIVPCLILSPRFFACFAVRALKPQLKKKFYFNTGYITTHDMSEQIAKQSIYVQIEGRLHYSFHITAWTCVKYVPKQCFS